MCHHNVRICVWVVLWLIVIGSKAVVSKLSSQLMDLDDDLILSSSEVHNLAVLLDSTLSFNDHIGKVVKTAFFHLFVISLVFDPLSVSRMLKPLYMLCYVTIRLL